MMTSRERQSSVTTSSISENGPDDDDQYEAFQDIIRTIRSRKAKRPVSQQSSGPSTALTRSPRNSPSVDLNLFQGGERTELTFNEQEEEEEEPPRAYTQEELNEQRVRNHIKERMQIYRNKKKEERRKLLEERKARWVERQKRLGIYVEPSESASDTSGSSLSGMTEEERQIKRESRRKLHKLIPLTTVVDELRKNLELETNIRGDFLETIRIIRGIKKEEFYREDTPEIYEEEEEEEEVEEEPPPVEEEEVNEEENPPVPKPDYKNVKARVISRWPKGHRHHTKAVKTDWSFLTHYSDAELTVELAYLLPEYMRDVERLQKARRARWNTTTNFKTKRIQRNLEFENWREEMMRIAYDEEFGRGKSKMFSAVPLPKIKETNSSVHTSVSSRVSLSDRADDNLSPRSQKGNVNSNSTPQRHVSPYKYNPLQKSPRQKEQTKNPTLSRNRNSVLNSQHKAMSKIYRPVGGRATSLANKAIKSNRTSDSNNQNTGNEIKANGISDGNIQNTGNEAIKANGISDSNAQSSNTGNEARKRNRTSDIKVKNGHTGNNAIKTNRTSDSKVKKTNIGNSEKQNGKITTGSINGNSANGRRIGLKDSDLSGKRGVALSRNATSTSDHQDSDKPAVTTITVHFNVDHMDNHTSSPNRTQMVIIPTGEIDSHEHESIIRIKSPIDREDNVKRLFEDIQEYRSKHPTVDHVKVEFCSKDTADIDWVRQYVEDQSHSRYKAKV